MTDVHTKEIRSYNMSQIRSKNTRPELLVRKHLFKNGFRYRIHVRNLPGNPDIVLKKYKTIIFIHGCFWHGHNGCKNFVIPKTNSTWWLNKIKRTRETDFKNISSLKLCGWKVIEIYECKLNSKSFGDTMANLIARLIK